MGQMNTRVSVSAALIWLVLPIVAREQEVPFVAVTQDVEITATSSGFEFGQLGRAPGPALLRPDGSLIVIHPPSNQIVLLDRNGKRQRVVGGTGGGPSEFRGISGVGVVGDTIWALDAGGPREFSLFSADLAFITRLRAMPTVGNPPARFVAQGLLKGGLVHGTVVEPSAPPASPPSFVSVVVARRDGTAAKEVLRMPLTGPRSFRFGRTNYALPSVLDDAPLLVRSPESDLLVLVERPAPNDGSRRTYRVTAVRPDGDTAWSRAIQYVPQLVPDSVRSRIRASLEAMVSAAAADSVLRNVPRYLPPVVGVIGANGGAVWIGERTGQPNVTNWLCLSAGVERFRIRLDSRHRPLAANAEALWSEILDSDDLPGLRRFRLAAACR